MKLLSEIKSRLQRAARCIKHSNAVPFRHLRHWCLKLLFLESLTRFQVFQNGYGKSHGEVISLADEFKTDRRQEALQPQLERSRTSWNHPCNRFIYLNFEPAYEKTGYRKKIKERGHGKMKGCHRLFKKNPMKRKTKLVGNFSGKRTEFFGSKISLPYQVPLGHSIYLQTCGSQGPDLLDEAVQVGVSGYRIDQFLSILSSDVGGNDCCAIAMRGE